MNVTGIVAAAGAGTYWTANVQLGTGSERFGLGWLGAGGRLRGPGGAEPQPVGVRRDADRQRQRHGHDPAERVPDAVAGPVTSTVGLVAYEGDLATPGDGERDPGSVAARSPRCQTPSTQAPAPRPRTRTSSTRRSRTPGALVTSRTPSFRNNLGYDADLFRTTGVLGNAQTSTQVRLSTSGDAYQPGVVTIADRPVCAQDHRDEDRRAATRTANLGDTLTYTVTCRTPQDGATGTTFRT